MRNVILTYTLVLSGILALQGLNPRSLECAVLAFVLVSIATWDCRWREIPAGWLLFAAGVHGVFLAAELCGVLDRGQMLASAGSCLAGAVALPAFLVLAALLASRFSHAPPVGGGDVKLFAVVGWCFGWRRGLEIMFASCVVALIWMGVRRVRAAWTARTFDGTFPFAPAIALACWGAMLMG